MSIEKMKKELELKKVEIAKEELELRIEERMEDVRRMQEHIKVQEQKAQELRDELKTIKEN